MNRIARFAGIAAAVALAAPTLARAESYTIDSSHAGAFFSVRHMMVSNVRGELGKVSGTVTYDPKDIAKTTIEATINPSSINSGEEKRDAHLKSPDFFDVAKFPTVTFKSTKVEKGKKGLKVMGDLTLHGVTKPIVLEVEGPTAEWKDPWGNVKVGAIATGKLNRTDFGLTWNKVIEKSGVAVGEEVGISIEVELQKGAAATAKK